MPVPGLWVHPGGLVLVLHVKEGVRDHQIQLCAEAQEEEEEAIRIHVSNAFLSDDGLPEEMVPSNSSVEIPKQEDLVILGDGKESLLK